MKSAKELLNLETHLKVSLQIGLEHGGMKRRQSVTTVEKGGFNAGIKMD